MPQIGDWKKSKQIKAKAFLAFPAIPASHAAAMTTDSSNAPRRLKHESRNVGLSGIAILPDRKRSLRQEVIDQLAESMKANGLLQPIVLRPASIGYYLVAGHHRLEAARKLRWESIRADIFDGMDLDHALLAEIDENLIRANLSPAEEAAHHVARKEIYERLHPQTKKGGTPGAGRGKKKLSQEDQNGPLVSERQNTAYTKDAAKKTGKSRTSVKRAVKRGKDIPNVADLAGTSLDKGDELDALASLPEKSQRQLAARAKAGEKVSAKIELKKIKRNEREADLGRVQAEMPTKRYGVIYADPPWRFEPYSRATGMDRAADNHYPTMRVADIEALPVPAADDCVLFLWATAPMLPEALDVMHAWGFDYTTNYVWAKDRVGTGYWARSKHELLLIGTRGKIPAPAPGTQWPSVIDAAAGEHSQKPKVFRELIERYFPTLPKIELFARKSFAGWDAWGNEAPIGEAAE